MGYYLALGDSITAGYGVGGMSFAALYYSRLLRKGVNLRYVNYGIPGLTTGGLARMLLSNTYLQTIVSQAEVITLTIGSNDLLHLAGVFFREGTSYISQMYYYLERNLELAGSLIRRLNPNVQVKVATIYNPLPIGAYARYFYEVQKILTQTNKIFIHWAKRYGFRVIPVHKAFQGREGLFIGADHLHPNSLGHQVIAVEFAKK